MPCPSYPRRKEPASFRKMLCISRHAKERKMARSPAQRQRPRAESASATLTRPVLPELTGANEVATATDGQRKKQ